MPRINQSVFNHKKEFVPKWLDTAKLADAGSAIVEQQKQDQTKQVFAKLNNSSRVPLQRAVGTNEPAFPRPIRPCHVCGLLTNDANHIHVPKRSSNIAYRMTVKGATTPSYMPQSVMDRLVVFRAVNALEKHAKKNGMVSARARFLRAIKANTVGKDFPYMRAGEFLIEFSDHRGFMHRVGATLVINERGEFVPPTQFTTPDGGTHPFTKEVVAEMTDIKSDFPKPQYQRSMKPVYRHKEPTYNPITGAQGEMAQHLQQLAAGNQAFGLVSAMAKAHNWDMVNHGNETITVKSGNSEFTIFSTGYGYVIMDDNSGFTESFEPQELGAFKGTLGKIMQGEPLPQTVRPEETRQDTFASFLKTQARTTTSPDAEILIESTKKPTLAAIANLNQWKPGWGDDLYIAYDFGKRLAAPTDTQLMPNQQMYDPATNKRYQVVNHVQGQPAQMTDLDTQQPVAIDPNKLATMQPLLAYLTPDQVGTVSKTASEVMKQFGIQEISTNVLFGKTKLTLNPEGVLQIQAATTRKATEEMCKGCDKPMSECTCKH